MGKLKRIAVLLLVCVSALCVLSCKKESAQAAGGANGSAKIVFMTSEPVMAGIYDRINAEYKKIKPDVEFEMIHVGGSDFGVKVDTTLMAGEQLDITFFNNMQGHAPRAMAGQFLAIEPYLEKEGINLLDIYYIDPTVEDGKMYGLPGDVKFWVMWLNKSDLDKAGLPVPPMDWTWDDFKEYSRKLTWGEGADKHYGSIGVNWMHPNGLVAFNKYKDNPLLTPDHKSNFLHPVIRESLQLRYDLEMVEKTQFPLSEIMAMNLDYRAIFFNGQASMLPMATNIIPQAGQTAQFPHDFVTTFAPIPMPKDGNLGWTFHDNRYYSIGRTSVYPQESYDYLRWFTTKGLPMKNVGTTAEKVYSTPIEEVIKGMTAEGPHLFDLEALTRVMTWPNLFKNHWYNVPQYTQELETIFFVEGNKAVIGEQTIDQAMQNMHSQAEAVIARFAK